MNSYTDAVNHLDSIKNIVTWSQYPHVPLLDRDAAEMRGHILALYRAFYLLCEVEGHHYDRESRMWILRKTENVWRCVDRDTRRVMYVPAESHGDAVEKAESTWGGLM